MIHQLASRRMRIPVIAGAALLLTASLVAPAWPATGTVKLSYAIRSPSGATTGTWTDVENPKDNECYTARSMFTLQPGETAFFLAVRNSTDARLVLFQGDDCSGERAGDIGGPGENRTIRFNSFRTYTA